MDNVHWLNLNHPRQNFSLKMFGSAVENIGEVVDSCTAGVFIRDMAYFHCDSLNLEYPLWKCLPYMSPKPLIILQ